jgi:hypothetical protein
VITRLLPTQISQFWDVIKGGVIDIGVREFPGNWAIANNIFQRCLAGVVQAWLCFDVVEDKQILKAFYLTTIEADNIDGSRILVILIVYIYKPPSEELIKESVTMMRSFARSCDCKSMTLQVPEGHREKFIMNAFGSCKKQTLYVFSTEG